MTTVRDRESATRSIGRRDIAIVGLIVATVLAIVAWRVAFPGESGPTGPTVPGAQGPLADGKTFVFITEVTANGLRVDVAEIFSGNDAREAAIEDGVIGADEDLPNDVYIRNVSKETVHMEVAPDAELTVLTFDDTGSIVETEIELHELEVAFTGTYAGHTIYGLVADAFPVTLTVDDGVVTEFTQVYLP